MRFLRRSARSGPGARRQKSALAEFWRWWASTGARSVAEAVERGETARIVDELGPRVLAIHPQLAWELGPGRTSRHVLVVSAEGNAELRPVARRWRMAAPPADDLWEYADARRPSQDPDGVVLMLDGVRIDLISARARARVAGTVVDVDVYHPRFHQLDERTRVTAAFLLLDAVLGEADVETWIGEIRTGTLVPVDPVPLTGLRSVVQSLRASTTDADGRAVWALMEGQDGAGRPAVAAARAPLRPELWPHLDTHVAVVVPYRDIAFQGLPSPVTADALARLQAHVDEILGGSGQVLAHETHGGRRVLHAYVDGLTPAADQVRAAVVGWDQGRVQVRAELDPAWRKVAHLKV